MCDRHKTARYCTHVCIPTYGYYIHLLVGAIETTIMISNFITFALLVHSYKALEFNEGPMLHAYS